MRHVEVDLTQRADLADRFRVTQTPTTLLLDADGTVRARIGGAPAPRVRVELDDDPREASCRIPALSSTVGADPGPPASTRAVPASAPRITAALLLITVVLGVAGASTAAFWLLVAITALFAWGAFAGIRRHPYGLLFAKLVRPRLAPPGRARGPAPADLRPGRRLRGRPRRACCSRLLGARSTRCRSRRRIAFFAAFLNAAFGYCLGCQIYLLLVRARVIPSV